MPFKLPPLFFLKIIVLFFFFAHHTLSAVGSNVEGCMDAALKSNRRIFHLPAFSHEPLVSHEENSDGRWKGTIIGGIGLMTVLTAARYYASGVPAEERGEVPQDQHFVVEEATGTQIVPVVESTLNQKERINVYHQHTFMISDLKDLQKKQEEAEKNFDEAISFCGSKNDKITRDLENARKTREFKMKEKEEWEQRYPFVLGDQSEEGKRARQQWKERRDEANKLSEVPQQVPSSSSSAVFVSFTKKNQVSEPKPQQGLNFRRRVGL